MWLEAILSLEDLRRALTQLLPVTLDLGSDGGTLQVGAPTDVSLVPDQGLRVVCPAELTWPILGVHVPISLNAVSFVLSPKVEQKEGVEMLVFEPSLEHADFAMVPDIIDNGLSDVINGELAKYKQKLAWNFAETLQGSVQLPEALSPRGKLSFCTHGAMVRVTTEAIVLAVSMHATIGLSGTPPQAMTEEHLPEHDVPEARNGRWPTLGVAGLAVALATIGVGFFVGRLTSARY